MNPKPNPNLKPYPNCAQSTAFQIALFTIHAPGEYINYCYNVANIMAFSYK